MNLLRFLSTRTLIFFAALWVASIVLIDHGKIHERIALRSINDNMPQDFSFFLKEVEGGFGHKADPIVFKEHARYYEILIRYMPHLADAHLMLGVSYYHLGRKQEALKQIEKAAVLNPHFFWTQYNLGALHYERGDYARAAEILEKARRIKPDIVMMIIKDSPVYRRLLFGVTNFGEIALVKMRSGYSECYRLLVLSLLKQYKYADAIRYAHEAVSLGLEHEEGFYYYAAVASYHMKQYSVSVNFLKQALDIDKDFPQAYHYLSLNLAALGDEAKAREIQASAEMLERAGIRKGPGDEEIVLRIM